MTSTGDMMLMGLGGIGGRGGGAPPAQAAVDEVGVRTG